jgi:hypothetical protein
MILHQLARVVLAAGLAVSLSACGGGIGSGLFQKRASIPSEEQMTRKEKADAQRAALAKAQTVDAFGDPIVENGSTVWDLFKNSDDPNTTVEVNKYIWQASLEVLNFLPIESVDPFTGVIVTGYGRPPGGGKAYRATIYVQDPALDARSLKVALQGQGGGAVAPETVRAVEDAILTRARQLRIRDSKL